MAGRDERKGEQPAGPAADEAARRAATGGEGGGTERGAPRAEEGAPRDARAEEADIDRREEEGYDQPESSAQKGTPRGR